MKNTPRHLSYKTNGLCYQWWTIPSLTRAYAALPASNWECKHDIVCSSICFRLQVCTFLFIKKIIKSTRGATVSKSVTLYSYVMCPVIKQWSIPRCQHGQSSFRQRRRRHCDHRHRVRLPREFDHRATGRERLRDRSRHAKDHWLRHPAGVSGTHRAASSRLQRRQLRDDRLRLLRPGYASDDVIVDHFRLPRRRSDHIGRTVWNGRRERRRVGWRRRLCRHEHRRRLRWVHARGTRGRHVRRTVARQPAGFCVWTAEFYVRARRYWHHA